MKTQILRLGTFGWSAYTIVMNSHNDCLLTKNSCIVSYDNNFFEKEVFFKDIYL